MALTWLGLLLLPNVIWVIVAGGSWAAFVATIPPSVIFIVGLLVWSRRPSCVFILFLPLYALLPFEIYYILNYGKPSSSHAIAIVGESNFSEAFQYIGSAFLTLGALSAIFLLLITIWIARLSGVLPINRWLIVLRWISFLPLMQYAWIEWDWLQSKPLLAEVITSGKVEILEANDPVLTPASVMLSDSFPIGIFFRIRDYLSERERIRVAADLSRKYDFRVLPINETSRSEVYVLVIGESSRPDHWGLNGYYRDTTPQLSQVPRLVSFQNTISPWAATRLAVPVILVGEQTPAGYAQPLRSSLIGLFNQAGFQTYWLSNQAPLGLHDSIITVHAHEADEVIFTNPTDHTLAGNNDGVLIPVFKQTLNQPYRKKLIVVHTMGSHKRYDLRYPAAFKRFVPDSLGALKGDTTEALINSYDNSIFFTDHLLSEFINELERLTHVNSGLVYLSDHGQTLPLNGCEDSGHGRRNEFDFRVAALLWVSESFNRQRPDLLAQAHKRQISPLESVGAFHTLAELANLQFPEFRPDLSWVSSDWRARVRWTNAVSDFDRAERELPCGKMKIH